MPPLTPPCCAGYARPALPRTAPTASRACAPNCRPRARPSPASGLARLMRVAGLRGISRRRFPTTTPREPSHRPANDLVGRDFRAVGPNRLWVADITYVPAAAGFLFLAVVLDFWSRRIVGWAMATDLRTRLVLDPLDVAVTTRKPVDVVHHSDQGSQSPPWRSAFDASRRVCAPPPARSATPSRSSPPTTTDPRSPTVHGSRATPTPLLGFLSQRIRLPRKWVELKVASGECGYSHTGRGAAVQCDPGRRPLDPCKQTQETGRFDIIRSGMQGTEPRMRYRSVEGNHAVWARGSVPDCEDAMHRSSSVAEPLDDEAARCVNGHRFEPILANGSKRMR